MTYTSEFLQTENKPSISLSVCQSGWQLSKKGHSYGPLIRDYYVIHYIVKGKGKYEANGQSYQLKAGDGFLVIPEQNTFYQADIKEPWEYYWVGFRGTEAQRLLNMCGLGAHNLVFYRGDPEKDVLKQHIADIYYASQKYASREVAMIGHLYLFFSCLMTNETGSKKYCEIYLEQAVKYIEDNFRQKEQVRVRNIAAHIGIERSYLYRIFKSEFNMSVKNYIKVCQLTKAKDFLQNYTMTIREISFETGFENSCYFSKQFKEAFGMSPTQYRKTLQL